MHKFITMGEIMLRLTAPNHDLIRMSRMFESSYGGSEANIALALANLGIDSTFFTVVPDNSLGKGAVQMLKSNGVHTSPIVLSTMQQTPTHRLGTYYLETGYGVRQSQVVYDRKHSSFSEFDYSEIDFDTMLDGYTWLHMGGITPALSESCKDLTLHVLQTAKEKGLTVSFDGNYRSTLWGWEDARDFCSQCLPYVNVLFGIEPYHLWIDSSDHSIGDVKDKIPYKPNFEEQNTVFEKFVERYPNITCIGRHVRYATSGSENSLKAFVWYEGETVESKLFTFNILDRVGGGDAFVSGLIYAMMQQYSARDMANFAVANSVLKHTIRGDASIIDDVQVIKNIMEMNFDINR